MSIMAVRLSCLAMAGILHGTWWPALVFALLSIPLPWVAVLIANDRPPCGHEHDNLYQHSMTAIETGEHPVIDS